MKKLWLTLALLSASSVFATAPGWLTSYDQALKFAAKSHRPILLNFTGSDWCGWCKRMQKETLATKPFIAYASSNLILVELDFPHNVPQTAEVKRANEALKQKFNVHGFPTFILVSAEGEELGRAPGYVEGGVPAFTARLDKWMAKAKPAASTPQNR